jgi:uncharacterized protein (TIGR03086 family)
VGNRDGRGPALDHQVVSDLVAGRHRTACAGFSRVTDLVRPDRWELPTPCTEWDARALVEHVIGFHEVLLLRPLGVRANRPKTGPAERWNATSEALFRALAAPGALDLATDLPGGGQSSPRSMLGSFTADVLVHTWDLAGTVGVDPGLDLELCTRAYDAARAGGFGTASGMFAAEVDVQPEADAATKLIAIYGRDPAWVGS